MLVLTEKRRLELIKEILLIPVFTILMVISANLKIKLPFTPVPFTLQTFVLYMSIYYLKKKAVISQILYVLIGLLGGEVFANYGVGLLYLIGPTGGYILGFVLSAFLGAYLIGVKRSIPYYLFLFTLSASIVYLLGISWLVFIHQYSLWQAFSIGLFPFVPAEIVKIISCALVLPKRQ